MPVLIEISFKLRSRNRYSLPKSLSEINAHGLDQGQKCETKELGEEGR